MEALLEDNVKKSAKKSALLHPAPNPAQQQPVAARVWQPHTPPQHPAPNQPVAARRWQPRTPPKYPAPNQPVAAPVKQPPIPTLYPAPNQAETAPVKQPRTPAPYQANQPVAAPVKQPPIPTLYPAPNQTPNLGYVEPRLQPNIVFPTTKTHRPHRVIVPTVHLKGYQEVPTGPQATSTGGNKVWVPPAVPLMSIDAVEAINCTEDTIDLTSDGHTKIRTTNMISGTVHNTNPRRRSKKSSDKKDIQYEHVQELPETIVIDINDDDPLQQVPPNPNDIEFTPLSSSTQPRANLLIQNHTNHEIISLPSDIEPVINGLIGYKRLEVQDGLMHKKRKKVQTKFFQVT